MWLFHPKAYGFTVLAAGVAGCCIILPAFGYIMMLKSDHAHEKRLQFARFYLLGYLISWAAFLVLWEIGNRGIIPTYTITGIIYPVVGMALAFYFYLCLMSYASSGI